MIQDNEEEHPEFSPPGKQVKSNCFVIICCTKLDSVGSVCCSREGKTANSVFCASARGCLPFVERIT